MCDRAVRYHFSGLTWNPQRGHTQEILNQTIGPFTMCDAERYWANIARCAQVVESWPEWMKGGNHMCDAERKLDTMKQLATELEKQRDALQAENARLREDSEKDLKDMRRFQAEFIRADGKARELEEENARLKEEVERLNKQIDLWEKQNIELSNLRHRAEKGLKELRAELEQARGERKRRYNIRYYRSGDRKIVDTSFVVSTLAEIEELMDPDEEILSIMLVEP